MKKQIRQAQMKNELNKSKVQLLTEQQEDVLIEKPLSSVELQQSLKGHTNIKTLQQIETMTSLDSVLGSHNHVILYVAIKSPQIGHWIAMFVNNNALYYADSYGMKPLIILQMMQQRGMPLFGQTTKLLQLIQQSKYANNFYYNTTQYQSKKDDVETCGRYAQTFVVLNDIYIKKNVPFNFDVFYNLMQYWKKKFNRTYDEMIVNLAV